MGTEAVYRGGGQAMTFQVWGFAFLLVFFAVVLHGLAILLDHLGHEGWDALGLRVAGLSAVGCAVVFVLVAG